MPVYISKTPVDPLLLKPSPPKAAIMNKLDSAKVQTFSLRVNIHCDGCKQKIKKLIQKIEGVYGVKIDADQGKVTISGSVNPATVVKKLEQSGKHAELCGLEKGSIKNSQMGIDMDKGGRENKLKKNIIVPKAVNMPKGFEMPIKTQKSVKFQEDELDATDDDDLDELEDGGDDEELEYGYNNGKLNRNPQPVENKKVKNVGKGGDVKKKRGFFDIRNKIMNMIGGKIGKGSVNLAKEGSSKSKRRDQSAKSVKDKSNRGGNDGYYDIDIPRGHKPVNNGQMGNYPMGQYGNFQAVPGLPAMGGGGYYPGMAHANPYMPPPYMMMNQTMPMMYARPPPPMGYMPPIPPPPMVDRYTHMFSDENTDSCSIM